MPIVLRRRTGRLITWSAIGLVVLCIAPLAVQYTNPRWYSWYLVEQISPQGRLVRRGPPAIWSRARHFSLEFGAQQVQGVGACNYFFGDYQLDTQRGSLTIAALGSTLMACGNGAPDTFPMAEDTYLDLLASAYRYEMHWRELRIYCKQQTVLVFRPNNVPAWLARFCDRRCPRWLRAAGLAALATTRQAHLST